MERWILWPFPKKAFEWWEPREFRRVVQAREKSMLQWWHLPLAGFAISSLFLLTWGVIRLVPNNKAPSFMPACIVSLAGGQFLVYLLLLIHRFVPTVITVLNDRVFRILGNVREEWKLADIQAFGLFDCCDFHLLVLVLANGHPLLLGVPVNVDLLRLEAFLSGKGLIELPTYWPVAPIDPASTAWLDFQKDLSACRSAELRQ